MDIIYFLLVGLVAGWLAGQLYKGSGFGLIGNIVVGAVGAVLGGWLFTTMNIDFYGLVGSIVAATVGALVLLFIVSLVKK
jgi:uncharacterized membrane protein YeaQ/YmgE (transglycosylase-associated protein family)